MAASPGTSPIPVKPTTSRQLLAYAGYIIGREIGQGTYSKVRIAVKKGVRYAVKIIPKHLAPREYVVHFLPRELAIIPKLHHPNIVRVFDILDIKQKVFIVMEMATKGDLLLEITKEGRFSEAKAFVYFEQIADAVAYLHKQHIVHRDLKCENVLLNPNHQVKLADFSFVRYCYNPVNKRKVLSGTYCGSAAYAAPEVIQNIRYRPKRYDSWSLGVILYVMVAGQLPFDDSNPFQQVRAQMCRQIYFPPSYRLSKLCKNLIRHLLEPVVLYRCTVTKAMKHPWMRRERIKRKLRDIKDKRILDALSKNTQSKDLRATQSEKSFDQTSPASSIETLGPKSVSASVLPQTNGSPSPKTRFSEAPTFYSRSSNPTDSEEARPRAAPVSPPRRGRRPRMSPPRFHQRSPVYPQSQYPMMARPPRAFMNPRMMQQNRSMFEPLIATNNNANFMMTPQPAVGAPVQYQGWNPYGANMAGGQAMMYNSSPIRPRSASQSPRRFQRSPTRGQVMQDGMGGAGGYSVQGRLPRRHKSQGQLRNLRVTTPFGHVSVSSSSSGEYY